jgi:pentatricopeptide repeat protein
MHVNTASSTLTAVAPLATGSSSSTSRATSSPPWVLLDRFLVDWDIVSYTAMVTGHAKHSFFNEAVLLFFAMVDDCNVSIAVLVVQVNQGPVVGQSPSDL